MYTANKPIFEFLYAFIRENFWEGTISDDDLVFYRGNHAGRPTIMSSAQDWFKRVERGPIPLTNLGDDQFPVSWLELGHITDIELDRSPQGFCYELRYQMPIFVKQRVLDRGRVPHETFRSDVKAPRGIGDIVSEVIEKAWDELHVGLTTGGNFGFVNGRLAQSMGQMAGQLELSSTNWWIKKWSVDVNGDIVDTIAEWKDVIHNAPTSRSKTINWDFTVFEQQSLT